MYEEYCDKLSEECFIQLESSIFFKPNSEKCQHKNEH